MAARAAAAAAARSAGAAGASAGGQSSNANLFAGKSLADVIKASNTTADPSQTSIGTTGGLMQGVRAGNLMGGVNQATGTTGGLMQDASAGMVSGAGGGDGRDLESRVTALEQNAPSNTLGTAKPVFSAQAQQAAAGIYGEEQVPGTFDRSLNNIEMARSAAAGSSPRAIMQGANDEKQAPSKLDPIEKTGSAAVGGISSGIGI